jgi:PAS domain S-box-containing protein
MKPEENRISSWIKAVQSGLAAWNRKLAREIRSRTEAETALVNSEEKFRLVFESANVGKSITLPTGEINVNQALCDMLGYTREELKDKKWQDITPPDEFETTQKPLDSLLQGRKDSVRFNKRYIHKNGSYVWADVSVVVHRDSDGKPLFLITTIIDITEREKGEEKVRLAHDRLRRFIDSNIVGVVIASADGKIIETNDYYLDMVPVKNLNRGRLTGGLLHRLNGCRQTRRRYLKCANMAVAHPMRKNMFDGTGHGSRSFCPILCCRDRRSRLPPLHWTLPSAKERKISFGRAREN